MIDLGSMRKATWVWLKFGRPTKILTLLMLQLRLSIVILRSWKMRAFNVFFPDGLGFLAWQHHFDSWYFPKVTKLWLTLAKKIWLTSFCKINYIVTYYEILRPIIFIFRYLVSSSLTNNLNDTLLSYQFFMSLSLTNDIRHPIFGYHLYIPTRFIRKLNTKWVVVMEPP